MVVRVSVSPFWLLEPIHTGKNSMLRENSVLHCTLGSPQSLHHPVPSLLCNLLVFEFRL
jgi:hypothetical protein